MHCLIKTVNKSTSFYAPIEPEHTKKLLFHLLSWNIIKPTVFQYLGFWEGGDRSKQVIWSIFLQCWRCFLQLFTAVTESSQLFTCLTFVLQTFTVAFSVFNDDIQCFYMCYSVFKVGKSVVQLSIALLDQGFWQPPRPRLWVSDNLEKTYKTIDKIS